jgi:hypothetical protein
LVDQSFTEEYIHDGTYFDVFSIQIPSENGDYKDFDAVVLLQNKKQSEFVKSIFAETGIKISCIVI